MAIITANNIKKSYGAVEALKGVSLNIEKGRDFWVLGSQWRW